MKAVRIHEFGGPDVLMLEDLPEPKAGDGELLDVGDGDSAGSCGGSAGE